MKISKRLEIRLVKCKECGKYNIVIYWKTDNKNLKEKEFDIIKPI